MKNEKYKIKREIDEFLNIYDNAYLVSDIRKHYNEKNDLDIEYIQKFINLRISFETPYDIKIKLYNEIYNENYNKKLCINGILLKNKVD